jgi:hypothetical protein
MSTVIEDENERLVAEQAVLVYRATVEAMHAAPHGQGMAWMESALLDRGREHLRSILERAAGAHPEAEKKRGADQPASVVGRPRCAIARPRP